MIKLELTCRTFLKGNAEELTLKPWTHWPSGFFLKPTLEFSPASLPQWGHGTVLPEFVFLGGGTILADCV